MLKISWYDKRLILLLKARYEQFIQSRKEDKSVKEREHALQTLDLGYHKYREILRDLEEGLRVRLRNVFTIYSSNYTSLVL